LQVSCAGGGLGFSRRITRRRVLTAAPLSSRSRRPLPLILTLTLIPRPPRRFSKGGSENGDPAFTSFINAIRARRDATAWSLPPPLPLPRSRSKLPPGAPRARRGDISLVNRCIQQPRRDWTAASRTKCVPESASLIFDGCSSAGAGHLEPRERERERELLLQLSRWSRVVRYLVEQLRGDGRFLSRSNGIMIRDSIIGGRAAVERHTAIEFPFSSWN